MVSMHVHHTEEDVRFILDSTTDFLSVQVRPVLYQCMVPMHVHHTDTPIPITMQPRVHRS